MSRSGPSAIAERFALPEHASQGRSSWGSGHEANRDTLIWRYYLVSFIAVLGGLTFNFILTFVNTRIFEVSDKLVILCEMVLIGLAFVVAADRRSGLYVVLGIFASYMVVLFALRGVFDPKPVRDALIPIVFIFAGRRLADIRFADRLVFIALVIVLLVGMVEYFAADLFLDYFNVLGYYIAKGTVTLEDTFGQSRGFFTSGARPEPRTLLPFLGQHRVSSVFLEPVSAGNFGAIAYSWALFSRHMKWRYWVMAGAVAVVTLGDARFGLLTCIVVTVAYPVYNLIARQVWLVLPLLALSVFFIYGLATGVQGGDNGVAGRLAVTSALLAGLPMDVILGATATDIFVSDSGLAYTLVQFGIVGFIALWAGLAFLPSKSARGWKFQSMVMIYFLLLLLISNSGYSIKTGALVWFLLGTALGAVDNDEAGYMPQSSSASPAPNSVLS